MNDKSDQERVSASQGVRRLLAFQVKLVLDAARDFALSPISIIAFIIDAIRKPTPEQSLYSRLMRLGQRSDEVINLFEEHSEKEHYTVDKTLRDIEKHVGRRVEEKRAPGPTDQR